MQSKIEKKIRAEKIAAKIEFVRPDQLKPNEKNPRVVRDEKFKALVKSIRQFPKMLEIRPVVVSAEYVILGGNQRFRAAVEAGLTQIPIIVATDLDEAEQKEFMIRDNVQSGEWDFEMLANEWDNDMLNDFGLFVPQFELSNDLIEELKEENMFQSENTDVDNINPEALRHEAEDKFRYDKDEKFSTFEVVIEKEKKLRLLNAIQEIKQKYQLEKIEDALMVLVDAYENSKKVPELA